MALWQRRAMQDLIFENVPPPPFAPDPSLPDPYPPPPRQFRDPPPLAGMAGHEAEPPPPEAEPPPLAATPSPPTGPRQQGGSNESSTSKLRAGLVAGMLVGAVVSVAAVVALVVFLVRRWRERQQGEGGGVDPPHQTSSPSVLESQSFTWNQNEENGSGSSTSRERLKFRPKKERETLKASLFQSHKVPAELRQLPESQLYSKSSNSSSVSTGDYMPVVSVGLKTFTYQELSEATNQFSQDNFLGQGGFGSVYQGFIGGGDVAIKKLKDGGLQGEREFLTEINVISRVHHRHLVSLVGYCISGHERLLVYEFVENNNLSFHLRGTMTSPVLDWSTRLSIAFGAAKGIAYLHEECHPRVIHRDIKSNNILLDSQFRAKVADFGLAKFVPDDNTHVTTRIIGTFGYLAPEYGSSGRLTEKSDVFSFGVVLLELITGRQPINLVEWASPLLEEALEDGKFETELIDPKLADNYDYEEMNRMVTCAAICVHRFPDYRPRMSQVAQVLEGSISPEKLKADYSKPKTRRPA